MNRNYSQPVGDMRYRRIYAGFRGIDFANHPINVDLSRSPYSENLWVDKAGVLHKRYPWERILNDDVKNYPINGIYTFRPPVIPAGFTSNEFLVVHIGYRLLLINELDGVTPVREITAWKRTQFFANAPSRGYQFQDKFYLLDGSHIWQIAFDEGSDIGDGQTTNGYYARSITEVATAPETQIAGYYRAKEVTELDSNQNQTNTIEYEWQWGEIGEKNLLTNRRINTFCGDGITEHTTFYLDKPGLKVTKVEIYAPSTSSPASQGTVTTIGSSSTKTNIRREPKQVPGNIIATVGGGNTYTTTGKTGSWYQIDFNGTVAYVHQSRVTYTAPSQQTPSNIAAIGDWETVTNWTQSEDSDRKCTKITFTTAPSAHPRGNGLPNIRVYCTPTRVSDFYYTAISGYLDVCVPGSYLALEILSVKRKRNGVETTLDPADYSAEKADDEGYSWNIYFQNSTPSEVGDEYTVHFIGESLDGLDLVTKCTKYGMFGEYNNDRIFYTGEPTTKNRDWYSEPSDPTCVLENSYTDIGISGTGIAGYLNMMSDMLIVKYDSGGTGNLFRRTATSDGDITIFPVKAYDGRGAVSDRALANIKGECVYLSPDGVYAFTSSDLGTRYGTQDKSYLLGDALKDEVLEDAEFGVWNDWLLLTFPNGHCYVADTAQQTAPSTTSAHGYEWFYWTGFPARNMILHRENGNDNFYFATPAAVPPELSYVVTNALCVVNPEAERYEDYPDGVVGDDVVPVPYSAQWNTAQDGMEEPAMVKYIETRGAIISLTPNTQTIHMAIVTDGTSVGDARWDDNYNPIDDDVDMIELHAAPDIPYVAINRRIPRFKHVQFIFKNNDPDTDGIGMLNIEFQYRYGRYIK